MSDKPTHDEVMAEITGELSGKEFYIVDNNRGLAEEVYRRATERIMARREREEKERQEKDPKEIAKRLSYREVSIGSPAMKEGNESLSWQTRERRLMEQARNARSQGELDEITVRIIENRTGGK